MNWIGNHYQEVLAAQHGHLKKVDEFDPIMEGDHQLEKPEDVIVIACEQGKHMVLLDKDIDARVVLFDWTGKGVIPEDNPKNFEVISYSTECKGHLMHHAWKELGNPSLWSYMAFIDDDVMFSMSSIEQLLHLAHIHKLTACQPAISHFSSIDPLYGHLKWRAGVTHHRVPMIEIMAPFIRGDLLKNAMPFMQGIRSGYGFDRYVLPLVADAMKQWRFACCDLTPMNHTRKLQSPGMRFKNQMSPHDEEQLMRMRCFKQIGQDCYDKEYYAMYQSRAAMNQY